MMRILCFERGFFSLRLVFFFLRLVFFGWVDLWGSGFRHFAMDNPISKTNHSQKKLTNITEKKQISRRDEVIF